ncbi:sulfurtransferase complex subunit TusD [Marinomonas sp. THO17]|uniref:sulfurtransferase complex subunit TusD n=1 Tax=Marinomonas sp. THO17 TaxID=3149048 RepID=UPI00336BB382
MQHTLFITGSPYQTKACHSALRFARAALEQRADSINGVFFYQDAVLIGNTLAQPPRDEINLHQEWLELAQQFQLPLYICIAAAVRRGVINESEANRYQLEQFSLADGFQLEGLGSLVELMNTSEKVIQFR